MDASTGMTPLLIDAKREYVGQLTDVLAPYVINYIARMYVTAQQQGKAPTLTFQRFLKEIPVWNSATIRERTVEIQSKYTFLSDLIAACFVAYVKILSSVKLHNQKPNIRLKLPTNDSFVHKVYVNVAREFYTAPSLISSDRATKISIVKQAVEASVRDMLPIEDILKAYLGNTVDNSDNTMNPGEMHEDTEGDARPPPDAEPADFPQDAFAAPSPDPFAAPPPPPTQAPLPPPPATADPFAQPAQQPDPLAPEPPKLVSLPGTFQPNNQAPAPPFPTATQFPPQPPPQPAPFPQPPPNPRMTVPQQQQDLFSDAEDAEF